MVHLSDFSGPASYRLLFLIWKILRVKQIEPNQKPVLALVPCVCGAPPENWGFPRCPGPPEVVTSIACAWLCFPAAPGPEAVACVALIDPCVCSLPVVADTGDLS